MLYNKIIQQKAYLHISDQKNNVEEEAITSGSCGIDFSDIYLTYYSKLIRFAKEYVLVNEEAENIVQDVFLRLWERQDNNYLIENMNAYLFRLVKNKCLDHLRHKISAEKCNRRVQDSFEIEMNLKIQSLDRFDDSYLLENKIEEILSDAINGLPPKCREIFLSSRIEGLKYREISERFNISVNTVENQMSIALKKLRIKLKDHLPA